MGALVNGNENVSGNDDEVVTGDEVPSDGEDVALESDAKQY